MRKVRPGIVDSLPNLDSEPVDIGRIIGGHGQACESTIGELKTPFDALDTLFQIHVLMLLKYKIRAQTGNLLFEAQKPMLDAIETFAMFALCRANGAQMVKNEVVVGHRVLHQTTASAANIARRSGIRSASPKSGHHGRDDSHRRHSSS